MENRKNIFALEGEWHSSLANPKTILAGLQFLNQIEEIKFIFRKVATKDDLYSYLGKASQKAYSSYKIIYLSFHGEPGIIKLGKPSNYPISKLADDFPKAFEDRIVHFGTCQTLKIRDEELKDFKKKTGARLVSGYTKSVDFIDSTLLDLAYFYRLQEYEKVGMITERIKKDYPGLYKRLGFVAI